LQEELSSGGIDVNVSPVVVARPAPIFEFEDLDGLPCGCVTAAFRAVQWGVTLVSLEAKGPHCRHAHHFIGQVLQLGESSEQETEDEEIEAAVVR
jgi:hypothetical protein